MMRALAGHAWVLFALFCSSTHASYCVGGPSPNAQPNTYPVSRPQIVHVRNFATGGSTNGKLFEVRHTAGNTTFPLLHLYGEPYAMGVAQGTLLKSKLLGMWDGFWKYTVANTPGGESAVVQMLGRLERDSKPYIPSRFTDELRASIILVHLSACLYCWKFYKLI